MPSRALSILESEAASADKTEGKRWQTLASETYKNDPYGDDTDP